MSFIVKHTMHIHTYYAIYYKILQYTVHMHAICIQNIFNYNSMLKAESSLSLTLTTAIKIQLMLIELEIQEGQKTAVNDDNYILQGSFGD